MRLARNSMAFSGDFAKIDPLIGSIMPFLQITPIYVHAIFKKCQNWVFFRNCSKLPCVQMNNTKKLSIVNMLIRDSFPLFKKLEIQWAFSSTMIKYQFGQLSNYIIICVDYSCILITFNYIGKINFLPLTIQILKKTQTNSITDTSSLSSV